MTFEVGSKLAKENDALFSEVSARNGTGIQELFTNLAGTLPGNDTSVQQSGPAQGGAPQKSNIVLENPTQGDEEIAKKKGGCC